MTSKFTLSLLGIVAVSPVAFFSSPAFAQSSAAATAFFQDKAGISDDTPALAAQRGQRAAARPASGRGAQPRASRSGQAHQAHQVRHTASSNINHNGNVPRDGSRNADRSVNRNVNRNINHNVDVDVHHDYGYRGWDDGWDDYHPFATAAVVTAGVALTSAVIGSIVNTVPPNCGNVVVNGISYYQCGNSWYQPQYAGTTVQYIVVNPPK